MPIDFSRLGKRTLGDLPPPPKPPDGPYEGVIKSWKWAESGWKDKETGQPEAQVHFTLKPTGFGEEIPDELRVDLKDKIFVAQMGAQTDAQVYYLQEFLRNLGVDFTGGKTLDAALPECLGAQVKFNVVVKSGDRGDIANVRRLRAATED